jgi:hypothetical protein
VKTFFEMTKDFIELQEMLEDDPECPALRDTLEGLVLNLEQKALNTVSLIKNIGMPIKSIDDEIKRLTDHKKAIENNVQRLKDYIRDSMVATGATEIKNNLVKIRLQSAAPGLDVWDIDAIPEHLKETKIEIKPKMNEIKKILKEGKYVSGATLKEATKFIRIY